MQPMTYSITKDRAEIEKLAIDIYINQNRSYNFIEGAIILGFNEFGTYKLCITIECSVQNDFEDSIIQVIKSCPIPIEKLRGCIMCFNVNKLEESHLNYTSICKCVDFVDNYARYDCNGAFRPFCNFWAVRTDQPISTNTLRVDVIFSIEKTEQDKLEDEMHRQMMEEYAKSRYE